VVRKVGLPPLVGFTDANSNWLAQGRAARLDQRAAAELSSGILN